MEHGFKQSYHDPCLFMKKNMICVAYVGDTIIGNDGDAIESEIHGLGVSKDEQHHKFELRDKGEVGDFLGIMIEKEGHVKFHLTQISLIDKVLQVSGIGNCNKDKTPVSTTHLGIDKDGERF